MLRFLLGLLLGLPCGMAVSWAIASRSSGPLVVEQPWLEHSDGGADNPGARAETLELAEAAEAAPEQDIAASRTPASPPDGANPAWMPTAPLDRACRIRGMLLGMPDPPGPAQLGPADSPVVPRWCATRLVFGSHVIRNTIMLGHNDSFEVRLEGVVPPDTPGYLEIEPTIEPRGGIYVVPQAESWARAALPHPLPTGVVDLGTVQLEAHRLIVAGQVFEDGGAAVGIDVEISLYSGRPHPQLHSVKTDAAGRFELRAPGPATHGTLSLRSAEHVPVAGIPFQAGDTGIQRRLSAAGELTGEVLCPPGQGSTLQYELIDALGVKHATTTRWTPAGGERSGFSFRNLSLGPARLRVSCPAGREQTISIEIRAKTRAQQLDLR